jgi:hypothetical protein
MRPTPAHLPDELLTPVCLEFGMRSPHEMNPAERATAQLIARARMNPNPKVSRPVARPRAVTSKPVSTMPAISTKCLAANDLDKE